MYTNLTTMATTSANTGVYTISASPTINTGLSTGGYNWAANNSYNTGYNSSVTMAGAHIDEVDITLKRKDKPELKIGATLDLIIESLYIIVPDNEEHEKNPALKSAYEEWQRQFQEQTKRMHPLKEAYDSYMMMKKLCREDPEEQ
jgi:hypothetical protein